MSNDGKRQPDGPLNEAEIASTSVAVPANNATQAQIDKGREITQALNAGDLTMHVTATNGTIKELPTGDAIGIFHARREITDEMATGLEVLYRATLARLGKTEDEIRRGCESPPKQEPETAERIATYRSMLEAIKEAARKTLPNPTTGKQEKNPFYGNFTYSIDLDDGLTEVSILEAIAWLEHKGKLDPVNANRLQSTTKEHMQRVTYRPRLRRELTAEEIKQELAGLETKAAEIIKPKKVEGIIAELEAQLNNGDLTLHVDTLFQGYREKPFLEGVFHYKKAGTLDAETAMRLAKLCIDKMLERNRDKDSIAEDIEGMITWQIITPEELSELISHLMPDNAEAARTIKKIMDLAGDDEAPEVIVDDTDDKDVNDDVDGLAADDAPPVHNDDEAEKAVRGSAHWKPEGLVAVHVSSVGPRKVTPSHTVDIGPLGGSPTARPQIPRSGWISGYPEISRLITGRRLAFVAAGLLVIVAGGATIITGIGRRPGTNTTDATAAVGASTETVGEPSSKKLAGEGETSPAPVPAPVPPPLPPTPTAAPAPTPRPATAPTPQTITIPVTTYPSDGGKFKVDTTDEARAAWQRIGYNVSVSMSFDGKKIVKLTDSEGNIYEVRVGTVDRAIAELQATLQAAQ